MKNRIERIYSHKFKIIRIKHFFIIIPILFILHNSYGQMLLSDVEFDKIEEEKVEEYLYKQMDNHIESFAEVLPSLEPHSSIEGYRFHEKEYIIKDSLNTVWLHYVHTNPMKAWNTNIVDFGFMFSKKENKAVYPNQRVEKVEVGQIIYLNLRLLKIKNLATAFEVITVDNEKGMIEFSYVDDNVTHGKQQLNFMQTPEGYTKIIHRSYFKSKSNFRDRYLYPYFHTRMTNNFHKNMRRLFNHSKSNESF